MERILNLCKIEPAYLRFMHSLDFPVETLISKAKEMFSYAYAPYSRYLVGAALLTKDGQVYTGCNIENVSFGPSNCAERTAFFKAVSEGKKDFVAIAIAGGPLGKTEDFCFPCGVCRQVMREFCSDDFVIISAKNPQEYKIFTLAELLPHSFKPENQVGASSIVN